MKIPVDKTAHYVCHKSSKDPTKKISRAQNEIVAKKRRNLRHEHNQVWKKSGYTYTSAILSYYYVLAILMCVVWNFTLSMVVNGLKIGIPFV